MQADERAVHDAHTTWIAAVNAGDLDRLLALMTDDVVFVNPGQAPSGRAQFPVGFTAAHRQSLIVCTSELQDVVVTGDVAYIGHRHAARRRRNATVHRRPAHHLSKARRPLAAGAGGAYGGAGELTPARAHRRRRDGLPLDRTGGWPIRVPSK